MRTSNRAFHLYGCKVDRRTLDALWRTLNADASPKARAAVSTTNGITKLEMPDLDDLCADLGNPNRVANLDLQVWDGGPNDDPKGERYSSVSLKPERAWIYVNGTDETWVRGRAQQIEDLLRSTRRKFSFDLDVEYALIPFASAALAFAAFILSMGHGWPVLVLLLLAVVALTVITWRLLRGRNRTEIVLDDSSRKPWSRADVISLVATVVAVLALVRQPHFGS